VMGVEGIETMGPSVSLRNLSSQGLHDSAELFGWFLLGGSGSLSGTSVFATAEILGDSLYAQGKFLSAIEKYKRALSASSLEPSLKVAGVRKKIAKAYIAGGNKESAMKMLESIRGSECDVEAELLLGKLYLDSSAIRAARACFKNTLNRNPLAIEAAVLLLESGGELETTTLDQISRSCSTVGIPDVIVEAMANYFRGIASISSGDIEGARSELHRGILKAPKCVPLTIALAEAEYEQYVSLSDFDAAERSSKAFQMARSADSWTTRSMDDYCSLLLENGQGAELTFLCSSLVEVDEFSPVAWRSSAMLCKLQDYKDHGSKLDAQLHRICEREAKKLQNPVSLRPSQQISLAEVQLRNGAISEAHLTAKDAIRRSPNSAYAYCVYAKVMISLERLSKATSAFQKALKLSPKCVPAVVGLARRYEQDGEVARAIKTLEEYVNKYNGEGSRRQRAAVSRARVEIVDILTEHREFEDAWKHLKQALLENPTNDIVLQTAEKLETSMRDLVDSNDGSERASGRYRARALNFDDDVPNDNEDNVADPF